MPKAYRYRLHRLKNLYRKAYGREPEIERPIAEEAAREAIFFLEEEIRRARPPVADDEDALPPVAECVRRSRMPSASHRGGTVVPSLVGRGSLTGSADRSRACCARSVRLALNLALEAPDADLHPRT